MNGHSFWLLAPKQVKIQSEIGRAQWPCGRKVPLPDGDNNIVQGRKKRRRWFPGSWRRCTSGAEDCRRKASSGPDPPTREEYSPPRVDPGEIVGRCGCYESASRSFSSPAQLKRSGTGICRSIHLSTLSNSSQSSCRAFPRWLTRPFSSRLIWAKVFPRGG